ncbi:MerR family transcriptional regulator [Streptomyces sp. NPDC091377]|uniref:MerR family transcriptional regulator n=1 Tax=Streptomyces sp. NPDC091377 TaxID=3365995 RepID=UPI00380F8670
MRIGEAAAAAGTTARALRFYEQRGLLPPPARTASGQREYGPGEVARVRVIRELLALGLTVEDVRSCADRLHLLIEDPTRRCVGVDPGGPGGPAGPASPAGPGSAGDAGGAGGAGGGPGAAGFGVVGRRIAALDAEIDRLAGLRENLARRLSGGDPAPPRAS